MTASTTRRTAAKSRIAAVGAIAVSRHHAADRLWRPDELVHPEEGGRQREQRTALRQAAAWTSRRPKVIKVGTDATYAPMEIKQGEKIVGVDPDIAAALGKQLGVRFEFTSGTFDTLLGALPTGRYDAVMSSMSDTKARQEGLDSKGKKTGTGVDFVDYFTASTGILVKKGNPEGITSVDDLCGKKLAVQRGTTYETAAKNLSAKCATDGRAKISIEAFSTDAEAQTRVKSGGAVADLNDSPVAAYIAKSAGGGNDFEAIANKGTAGPFGIAVDKKNTQLRDALRAAVDAIIADGTYKAALDKWGAGDGAVTKAVVNGGS